MRARFKRSKWKEMLFCMVVFATMLVFFTVLHPIPIMDEDDVIYTVLVRKAVPIPGAWNPSRMMPEVLTSLCGNIAALCTAFGFGRFINCQVAVWGVVFSLFITVYIYSFLYLMKTRFRSGSFQSMCLSVLFLMLHFLVFRTQDSRNSFMFHTYDACCVFYYTVPALFGCSLVMWLMSAPDEVPVLNGKQIIKESFIILALYFEIFSNLFGSVIVAAYAGYRVLKNLYLKEGPFWKKNSFWIAIVLLWILAGVLEATGGRAAGARNQAEEGSLGLFANLEQAFFLLGKTVWQSNLLFRLMLVAVAFGVIILVLIKPDRSLNSLVLRTIGEIVIWGTLSCFAVMILCGAVEPLYAARPEAIFVVMFQLFLLMILGIRFILQRMPFMTRLLPILLVIVCSMTNTRFLTFQDSNPLLLDGHVAVAIENEIYESIIAAANAGETEITVDVIHSAEGANWPHDGRIGDPVASFFWKYGIIDHEIRVHTNPSDEMNARYHVPIP